MYIQNFNVQNPVVSAIFDIEIVFFLKLAIPVFKTRKPSVGKSSNKAHFKADVLKIMVIFNKSL